MWAIAPITIGGLLDELTPRSPAGLNQSRNESSSRNRKRTGLTLGGQAGSTAGTKMGGCDATAGTARSRKQTIATLACPRPGAMCRRHGGGGERRVGARWAASRSAVGPGGAAVDGHQSAARFQSARRADHLLLGPRY